MTTPSPYETRVKCLPTYILIDTSSSMEPVEDTLNDTIFELVDELVESPRISDFAYVSLISFDTEARVVLEMDEIHNIEQLPRLKCQGVTDFTRAFQLLRDRIDRDVPRLNTAGREVLRPVAFVLTDGQPTDARGARTDAWRDDYARLTDMAYRRHPVVVPFGFGNATANVLIEMATERGYAFLARETADSEALRRIFATLLNTLVTSAEHNDLTLPTSVDGFRRVSQDIID
jgi:uncharacterized protein YegL